jgi:hypothetical protein
MPIAQMGHSLVDAREKAGDGFHELRRAKRYLEDFAFLAAFFGFVGFARVASTVREICTSVTPLDTAFRTALLMRFTAFFFFFALVIDSPSQIAII